MSSNPPAANSTWQMTYSSGYSAGSDRIPYVADPSHGHIHEGVSFHLSFITGSMPANSISYHYFVGTGSANLNAHMSISFTTSTNCVLTLYEGNKISTTGSYTPIFNRLR